jgi:iron complex transport system ATP-binding protein
MNEQTAIAFDGLGHRYGLGAWVFRDYTARLQRGRVAALLGRNGRGKTTLLKLLVGVLKPTAGRLDLRGRIALAPQSFQASFDYSALDIVLMGRARQVGLFAQPSRRDEQAALAALDRFGLADRARRPFLQLSGGQRQLVLIARALVSDAEILVLDEPAAALDLRNQTMALDWIARLSREHGLTVLFTTHHPQHALDVADDVWLMLGEDRLFCGPASSALSEAHLSALYETPIKRLAFEYDGRLRETLFALGPASQPRALAR